MQAECDLPKVVPMNTCKDGARDYVTTQKRIVIINNLGVTAEGTTVLARVLAAVSDRSPGKLNTPES